MTTHTLGTSIATGITLTTSGTYASPFTVTSTGTIADASGIGLDSSLLATIVNDGAIHGTPIGVYLAAGGDITNAGKISGAGLTFAGHGGTIGGAGAIQDLGGGTIDNLKTGTIAGNLFGIVAVNGAPLIENAGLISASDAANVTFDSGTYVIRGMAIDLLSGGTLINDAGAKVSGFEEGIYLHGAGLVQNAGTIMSTGTTFAAGSISAYPNGVALNGAGTLINLAGGHISGVTAVYAAGKTGAADPLVNNAGTITGTIAGVYLLNASLTNSGLIKGTFGVDLAGSADSLTNSISGTISASGYGVVGGFDAGEVLHVTNAGLITASTGDAIVTSQDNILTLTNTGTISSGKHAAVGLFFGTSDNLVNQGLMQGVYGIDIFTSLTGTVAITNTGTIQAEYIAIDVSETFTAAGAGLITNAGLVNSSNATLVGPGGTIYTDTAVQIGAGATLVNEAAGRITGAGFGVGAFIGTGTASINNAGTINGAKGGIESAAGETLDVINSGTLISSLSGAANLTAGGRFTNTSTGVIQGAGGVAAEGTSVIELNQGSISAGSFALVAFTTLTGTATLDNTGTITTAYEAVGLFETFTSAGAGLVENAGLIDSTGSIEIGNGITYTPTAVQIEAGATFINSGTVLAAGIGAGDYAGGGHALIENAGLIDGAQGAVNTGGAELLTLVNTGTLIGSLGSTVNFEDGGRVTNASTGLIRGASGVFETGPSIYELNQGNISVSSYALQAATTLTGTATLDNTGTITTAYEAVGLFGTFTSAGAGLVENAGLIKTTGSLEVGNGVTYAPDAVLFAPGATFINTGTVLAAGFGAGPGGPGTASINNAGMIDGAAGAITSGAGDTLDVVNTGTLIGSLGSAVYLGAGGRVTNASTGVIHGSSGITGTGANIYELNQGNITVGSLALQAANALTGTATLDNTGTIITAYEAVELSESFTTAGAGLVENAGLIKQTLATEGTGSGTYTPAAVQIESGATFINTGTVSAAGFAAADFNGTGHAVITNSGLIDGALGAVNIAATNLFTLINSGTIISAKNAAVYLGDGGTIIDSGLIEGGTGADAIGASGTALTLILETGAAIKGSVFSNVTAGNALTFASLSHGAIDLGGTMNGFDDFAFNTGAAWSLSGTTAELASHQTISGFAKGDSIVLEGFSASSASFGTAGLVLNGSTTLDLKGNFSTTSFALTDSGGKTTIALASAASASFITSVGTSGADTLTALGKGVTLNGGAGAETLIGYAGFGTTFSGTEAGLDHDKLLYYGGSDLIDITNLGTAGTTLAYTGSTSAGTLNISVSGVGLVDSLTFASGSSLSAALFHISSDGHGGTYLG